MTRTLPASVATAVTNNAAGTETFYWLSLLRLDLDSGNVYMHSGYGDFTWDSKTWLGVGGMGSLSGVTENNSLGKGEITADLSHIDLASLPDFVGEFTTNDPVGRDWYTYLVVLNEDYSIKDVVTMDSGFIGSPEIIEGKDAGNVALKLLNETTRLALKTFYRMTNQSHQAIWSGDTGFQYVTDTNLAEINWGRTSATIPSGGGGYGGTTSSGGEIFDNFQRH